MRIIRSILIAALLLISPGVLAQTAPDPELEMRAREIGRSLRCVVCQNQSIEESDATLAEDMRTLVRRRLADGDSDEEVINFMQERYGDFVLMKPPVQSNTYILWFGPFALLAFMLLWYVKRTRTRKPSSEIIPPLDEEEKRRLERLLGDDQ